MGPGWRSGQLWAGGGSCGIANRPDILEELWDVPGKLWDDTGELGLGWVRGIMIMEPCLESLELWDKPPA